MATGVVKWFSDDKGYGFITPDEGSRDLFVHHTGIAAEGYRSLAEGARVTYEEEQGDKGPKAVQRHEALDAADARGARRRAGGPLRVVQWSATVAPSGIIGRRWSSHSWIPPAIE